MNLSCKRRGSAPWIPTGSQTRDVSHAAACSATQLLENCYDIRTVQELFVRKSVTTTMIFTHVLNLGGREVQSPADLL